MKIIKQRKTKKPMVKFERKKIEDGVPLGEHLKKSRNGAGISISELSKKINVKQEYLENLEKGEYLKMPGDVFVKNFIIAYANFFNLNLKSVLYLYNQEKKVFKQAEDERMVKRSFIEAAHHKKSFNFAIFIRYLLVVVVVVILLTYLGWEIHNITKPPILELENPKEDMVVEDRSIEIIGKTIPEAEVSINDQVISVSEDGSFTELVNLQSGLNTVKIVAQKKRSRKNTIIREILVKE